MLLTAHAQSVSAHKLESPVRPSEHDGTLTDIALVLSQLLTG